MKKKSCIIIITIFVFSLSQLNAKNYKILTQEGKISVIVNEKDSILDIKTSLPEKYFVVETKEKSYALIEGEESFILITPLSRLLFKDGSFSLESGYIFMKSKSEKNVKTDIFLGGMEYKILAQTVAIISHRKEVTILSANTVVEFSEASSHGVKYFLEPNQKAKIIPFLSNPLQTVENEKALIENAKLKIDREIASSIDKVIQRYSFKIFETTKNETEVFRVVHPNKGRNVFLIVPHGDERTGTDVAKDRAVMPIKSGSLTIVPVAVAAAYSNNSRSIEGLDINNRFFKRKKDTTETDKLATKYMKMLKEYDIDLVLTLHEGNGVKEFFGDSIIYDTRKQDYVANKIVTIINKRIEPMHFKFKQMYYPMPTTITYYAMQEGIEAYGIELTRNLDYEKKRAIMHAILEEFFKHYGI